MSDILILSAGRRVSLLRAFQTDARRHGLKVSTADLNPAMSAACHMSEHSISLPAVTSDEYTPALRAYCQSNDVKMVVPTIDTELPVLARIREEFAEFGCKIVVADQAVVDACCDKRKTADFFKKFGLNSPALYDAQSIQYPMLIKPYDGSLSKGIHIIGNESELTESIKQNPKNLYCQYIDPRNHDEYTCDVYFDESGHIKCVVPRLRIEVRGGEVSKGKAEKNDIVPFLRDRLKFVPGARGCLTIQFMKNRESGELFLIEINPRFGGGYPLSSQAGARYQDWLIHEYILNEKIEYFDGWTDGLIMLRFDEEVFC